MNKSIYLSESWQTLVKRINFKQALFEHRILFPKATAIYTKPLIKE